MTAQEEHNKPDPSYTYT